MGPAGDQGNARSAVHVVSSHVAACSARVFSLRSPLTILASTSCGLNSADQRCHTPTRGDSYDQVTPVPLSVAANEMAVILFSLTMITGMLFSKAQWGAYWQGDPRQTSFLMNLLIVGAYMILRMAFPDEQRRAHTSAVYNVASLLPTIFLVGVYPRLKQVVQVSSHPSTTIQQGLLKGEYGEIFLLVWGLLLATTIWMYRQRAKAGELELELESHNAKLDVRGDSAHIGVVRPVSVSERDS